MAVHRSGPTPPFWEYVCRWGLVDPQGQLPGAVSALNAESLRIPTFQRGISWGVEEVDRFLESDSILYGNVIIGMFPSNPAQLVDGLQRLAVGTLLLEILWSRVLSPIPSHPAVSGHFGRLAAAVNGYRPVFESNHQQLLNHSREAIKKPYGHLLSDLTEAIEGRLTPQHAADFAAKVNRCFLDKQVAMDAYFNFSGAVALATTFIGLNTVRVELGPVDLIRSHIVDRAAAAAPVWPPDDIAAIENDITEAFTIDGKPSRELLPTATVILKCLQSESGLTPILVFPGWPHIQKAEVDRFLDFLAQFGAAANGNNYLYEVREAGSGPLSIVLLYYYRRVITHETQPSFITGGTHENQELHTFLRAVYRTVIDGSVGRLGPIAEGVTRGTYASLDDAANAAVQTTGSGTLAADPATDWLRSSLSSLDSRRSRRVFNACLLPLRANHGGPFDPLRFGRTANQWQVDHLLPGRNLAPHQPGYDQGDTLRNFAPLTAPHNRVAANTPASQKLLPGGMYENITLNPATGHPFNKWLLANQGGLGAALDNQAFLEPNANPAVGDQRIGALVELLQTRL